MLTLTRDRLDYTKHCFSTLEALAGCDYDHFVLDQGSGDGTQEWLRNEYAPTWVELLPGNIGVSRGINRLLDQAQGYDVIVKFDNDCEPVTENALADCAQVAVDNPGWILSPRILGLKEPPGIQQDLSLSGHPVAVPSMLGGIFMCAHASVYDGYRHDEQNPVWGMDDVNLTQRVREQGGNVGYLSNHEAWHYRTTSQQERDHPVYFERKMAEFTG